MAWPLQDAKQRLSELVRQAIEEGPQVVTRHGKETAVVMSIEEFERLSGGRPDFKAHLRGAPDLTRLRICRDRAPARKVKL
ncbi:MAG TPA: type II toxin-antitoxin system Phd/YefM family antitoxin [Thermoanaerobaculia bacterium]|jgi:prevent-host-death family protein|nr:type II toxin-antitoxin system Phd/YefM family antitoxin [Thermoanaerobaculia bacterium]